MIHQWKKAQLEGAADIFERGGKAVAAAETAKDTCAPARPGNKHGPQSDDGSPSATTKDPAPPMAVNCPPWSTSS